MIIELFPFQKIAVNELRAKAAMALNNYRAVRVPQVVSLQAPTGSGKTIIMASFIEDVYFGSGTFAEGIRHSCRFSEQQPHARPTAYSPFAGSEPCLSDHVCCSGALG